MRSGILLVLKLSLVCLWAIAPRAHASQLGVQAGVSLTSFSTLSSVTSLSSGSTDFLLGGYYEMDLAGPFSLQPELMYRGAGDAGDWITVPILAKFKVDALPVMKPYIVFGPEFSVGLSNSFYKKFDFALDAGAGLEFAVAPGVRVVMGGRYVLGLIDVNSNSSLAGTVKTRHIYVTGGVGFEF